MSNETGIQTVSLQSAADQLKDKIHSAFAELIPPDQWKGMIEAELKKFTSESRADDGYGRSREVPSLLHTICKKEFEQLATEMVRAHLAKPEYYAAHWEGKISEAINKWLTDNAEKLIQATVISLAGHAAQSVISSMPHVRIGG